VPTYRTKVGEGGRVSLPDELCRRLNIVAGTPVEFFLALDGHVHFHAITGTAAGFAGAVLEKRSPPLSIREMDDAIADTLVEKYQRVTRQAKKSRRNPKTRNGCQQADRTPEDQGPLR